MKVSMPTGMSHGWGIAGQYLVREISKLSPIEGVTLHSASGPLFTTLDEEMWNEINIGYCFFEEEIIAYHHIPEVIKRWDYMVAGSSWCEHHLRIAGMDRTTTILQGIDPDFFHLRPPMQDDQRFIVFSGGKFEFRKGQDIVIAAMKIFMERHSDAWLAAAWHNHWPESVRTMEQTRLIDFTSFEASCSEIYSRTLACNGLDMERVILYPCVDNRFMADIYAGSHVGLFPNRCEGGNNMAMCEYMACGRTVIASNRTGHADVITHDNAFCLSNYKPVIARNNGVESGVWFEAEVAEVVEMLEQAYQERGLLQRKAVVAAADMLKLSWEETARQFHAIASKLSEERAPALLHKTAAEQIEEASLLFGSGQLESSESIFRKILNDLPFNPELHNSLATVLDSQKRYREAAAHYSKALALRPDFLVARFNLANTLKRMGDTSGCRENLQVVLEVDPEFQQAWQNLASIYFDEGNLEDAAGCLEHVISISPEKILVWAELGDVYHRMGDAEERALSCFERVIANRPDFAAAYNSKGLILHEQWDYEGAENCYRAALAIEPDDPLFMNNLALSMVAQARPAEALQWLDKSLKLEPDSATTRFNRGTALLLVGDWVSGWRDFEYRFEKNDPVYLVPMTIPRWNGEELSGKTIIVRMEQGYGDCIQSFRFLPMLHETGARIIVECMDDRIKSLLVHVEAVDKLYLRSETHPDADFQVPIFSLPQIFGTDLSNIPNPEGYLKADSLLYDLWENRIGQTSVAGTLKVGLVWGGRKTRLNANRSLLLEDLAPLFEIPGISWYSLQVGEDAQQLENYKEILVDIGEGCITFADTAAAIANLDLVITIDTSVAHLCGALGAPAWIMLKSSPDWRWLLGRSDSPWYSSLTLFRQTVPGEWKNIVLEVAAKLIGITGQKKTKVRSELSDEVTKTWSDQKIIQLKT